MFLLIRNSGRCRRGYARNLHSTMFLLIQMEPWRLTYRECNLHSTMFLLIRTFCPLSFKFLKDLHSTMFLLIHTYSCWMGMITGKFTFHNVSINSETSVDFLPLITVFTFHNVSINSTAMVYP